ncbi:MAG: hypothetical protein ACJ8LM_17710 [Candidatus Udaeobacter sp.]
MVHPIRYTCPRELFPHIEAALAANAYEVVAKAVLDDGDNVSLVMRSGAAEVLLVTSSERERAEIEVWGPAQAMAVQLLKSLPYDLVHA